MILYISSVLCRTTIKRGQIRQQQMAQGQDKLKIDNY